MHTLVITGAAGGIGVETVKALASEKLELLCIDTDRDALDRLTEMTRGYPGARVFHESTLDSPDACMTSLDWGNYPVCGLVHLAGVFEKDVRGADEPEIYHRAIAHNLTNAYFMAHATASRLDSSIETAMVFISSLAFRRGSWAHVPYAAAKGGLVGMTRALSRRLAPGVRVNALAPGIIDTKMPQEIIAERGANIVAEIPLARVGAASEVASVIRFLMSQEASYITGQVINVDGGVINS